MKVIKTQIFKNKMQTSKLKFLLLLSLLMLLTSCNKNYITYYSKVNQIDSIYRLAHNPKLAIEEYREIFKKYPPKNQERIEEFATYITLADQYNEDFGGKKSLYKLIPLIAPYGDEYKKYLPLFNKYGIDNQTVIQRLDEWKNGHNKVLIDSFQIALKRDQEGRPFDTAVVRKNVKKNAEFFIWTLKNHGFPSSKKIGWFPMPTFMSHLSESKEYYPYIREKLGEYLISGECPPRDYARMVDMHLGFRKQMTMYGFNLIPVKDSAEINRNRKSIGIPTLKHSVKIRKDKFKSLPQYNTA